ncbi:MAG: HAMP domain-containing histidine kinase, partial [Pedosphaera parvula]|nr:HAMP domain-containing histidine kinase [Pedosphaera parvula]
IRMPGMSGIELLHHLKELDPAIEVIILTAYETLETARQALRLGACDYLAKPFDLAGVRTAVASAMERRELTDEIRANNLRLTDLKAEIQNQKIREEIARTRGEIYASVIHDINSPITIISGFVELMNGSLNSVTNLEGASLEEVRSNLAQVSLQVSRCIEISTRYLAFLRQRGPQSASVEVGQVLRDAQDLLRNHPSKKGHDLVIRPMANRLLLRINGTDLIQIVLNLAINALQCSAKPHRVEVEAGLQTDPLDLARFTDGPHDYFANRRGFQNLAPLGTITVRDNGAGIPANILPRIFEPFFTTRAADEGNGLGLSIVHRLVAEARGGIHVHSEPGQGTRFTLYLPAHWPAPAIGAAQP